jgi:hypothetical protein
VNSNNDLTIPETLLSDAHAFMMDMELKKLPVVLPANYLKKQMQHTG